MKDSHILIIGGTGFVGKVLVGAFRKHGFENVLAVSRSSHSVDVTNQKTLEPFIAAADYVINMAGFISFLREDRDRLLKINNEGALNVLKVCEGHKNVKRLIHISSTAAFGFSDKVIDEETFFDWEKSKFLGYSYSKFLPNKAIDESPLATNIVYPPLVIGADDRTNTIRLFKYVYKKKMAFVPPGINGIIDVRDLCEAIVVVLMKAGDKQNYIVNGENVTFAKLFSAVASALGQNIQIFEIPGILKSLIVSIPRFFEFLHLKTPIPAENAFLGFKQRKFSADKIRRDIGFEPLIGYKQSLKDALKTFTEDELSG